MTDPGENIRLAAVFLLGVSVGICAVIVWLVV